MFVPKTNEAKALSKRNKKLAKGVKWLAEHTPKQPKLSTYYLKDVLENKVELLLANMSQRQKQTEFVKYLKHTDAEAIQPEIFVNEFNTQISRVIDELNDSTNRDVAFWPVPEFTVRINDDDTDVSGMVSSTDQWIRANLSQSTCRLQIGTRTRTLTPYSLLWTTFFCLTSRTRMMSLMSKAGSLAAWITWRSWTRAQWTGAVTSCRWPIISITWW